MSKKILKELWKQIKAEARFVDKKQYSHNIITLTLGQIADEFGQDEANAAIRDLNLGKLGWRER